MINIGEYIFNKKIYESYKTIIYQGNEKKTNHQVILKLLHNRHPKNEEMYRVKQEYEILNSLKSVGVFNTVELRKYENNPVIIMDYIAGKTIKAILKEKKLDVKDFLNLAIKLIKKLGEIHENKIMHKDITLSNILFNQEKNVVTIIDFSSATKLSHETPEVAGPDKLEGTLYYISPEQTARMNRSIDYRTDFYSSGVCFYKMITGRMPFISKDPLELIHCHIAKIPTPPNEINQSIPETISNIIIKLLEKKAEDRYQSYYGILSDLEKFYKAFVSGKIITFEPGEYDFSEKFSIPEKLYGRENEISLLTNIYKEVSSGTNRMIYFTGPPGIGKSILIKEVHKLILENNGRFITGKYDQYNQDIPYSGIAHAFCELTKQLLTESEADLTKLKEKINGIVGSNGKVILDIIPDMELIIGKQPVIQPLPAAEAQNRFISVFMDFFKIFCDKEHPLILFLDDLQWVDNASLKLLKELFIDPDEKYFLFIGAFRDTEVNTIHPLAILLDNLRKKGINWHKVILQSLEPLYISELLSDTLHVSKEKIDELSELIYLKTHGNPFFVKEFCKYLYQKQLIHFIDSPNMKVKKVLWEWDINGIRQAGITDNVIELMGKKIKLMSNRLWGIMKIACCIGNEFSLTLLARIFNKSLLMIDSDVREIINEGMIIKIGNRIKFTHDKIQEAAYSLIKENELPEINHLIGKVLLEMYEKEKCEENIFSLAQKLNAARQLLTEKEKESLININFAAGKKAKASSAFKAASLFFKSGINLLHEKSWENNYSRTYNLYIEYAESEYLVGNHKSAEQTFMYILHNSMNVRDKINTYSYIITYYMTTREYRRALESMGKALKLLGISIPLISNNLILTLTILKELIISRIRLGGKKPEQLINLPQMKNINVIAIMNILYKSATPAGFLHPNFVPILYLKLFNLSLKYGNGPHSPIAYFSYGFSMFFQSNNIEDAYGFGEVAVSIVEKINDVVLEAPVKAGVLWCTRHLKCHLKDIGEAFKDRFPLCLKAGNFEYLGYCFFYYAHTIFYSGIYLDTVNKDLKKYIPDVIKLNQPYTLSYYNQILQGIENLLFNLPDRSLLDGQYFNEKMWLPECIKANDHIGIHLFYIVKLFLSCIFEEYDKGLIFIEEIQKNISPPFKGIPQTILMWFYKALTLTALYSKADKRRKRKYLKEIKSIVKYYKKLGTYNPFMHLHKYHLLTAELFRITNRSIEKIVKHYDEAIRIAGKNEVLHEQALANERAAQYFLEKGMSQVCSTYLTEAYYCYDIWGAKGKVEKMLTKHPGLIYQESIDKDHRLSGSITPTIRTSKGMDLKTIIKASHALSKEIKIEDLLKKMMIIVLQNTGAERGYYLVPKEDTWYIEAEAQINETEARVMQSILIEVKPGKKSILSPGIVNFVARTKKSIVLYEAVKEGDFKTDPYIIKNNIKSLLCLPILSKGHMTGILYLENNLSPGVFTQARLNTLKTLASQIAISIENARIYKDLDTLVEQRTQELNNKTEELLKSIVYASHIQNSILPADETFSKIFKEYFVIWKSKQDVGGDFYWLHEINPSNLIITLIDCTGHGVPGAFMTMLSHSLLENIIIGEGITDPANILCHLNQEIKGRLHQHTKSTDINEPDDGVDISICRFNLAEKTVIFAGAMQPVFYYQPGKGDTLIEVQGDKKESIGYRSLSEDYIFKNHILQLNGNETFYLASDGIWSQLGGENNFPWGKTKFKESLVQNIDLPLNEQKDRIMKTFNLYKKNIPQIDDITLIGLKIQC